MRYLEFLCCVPLGHQAVGTEYFLNLLQGEGHLLVGVGGHEAEADERIVGCYSRRDNGVDKDALV